MVTCDLRAILKSGRACWPSSRARWSASCCAIVIVYVMFRGVLPQDGWKMLAALSATWTGGSANLVAVKQAIGLSDSLLPRCCSPMHCAIHCGCWSCFRRARSRRAFNRWTRAGSRPLPELKAPAGGEPAHPGGMLLWLGLALFVGLGAARSRRRCLYRRCSRHLMDRAARDGCRSSGGAHAVRENSRAHAARERAAGDARRGAGIAEQFRGAWPPRRSSFFAAFSR